jgi:glycosyltransferase involved in cell wall biosynthesis
MNSNAKPVDSDLHSQAAQQRVSVIIPNHNYGRYIAETLNSVLQQTHQALDIIVVDDGSTDDSVAVISNTLPPSSASRRTVFHRQSPNSGKLSALNAVMHEITSPYMLTLDADDQLTPDYIERTLQTMLTARQADPHLAIVYSDCLLIDEHSDVIDRGRSTDFDADKLKTMSYIPEPALCLSAAYLSVMPFDTSIKVGTKHHKWLRMVDQGWTGLHIPEPLFHYRMHDNNLSGIGKRVLSETDSGQRGERILSGYWITTHC